MAQLLITQVVAVVGVHKSIALPQAEQVDRVVAETLRQIQQPVPEQQTRAAVEPVAIIHPAVRGGLAELVDQESSF
jgi:hypothetical protein